MDDLPNNQLAEVAKFIALVLAVSVGVAVAAMAIVAVADYLLER